jgi:hypothetical protein
LINILFFKDDFIDYGKRIYPEIFKSTEVVKKYMTIINQPKFEEFRDQILKKQEFTKLKFFYLDSALVFKIPLQKQKEFLLYAIQEDVKKNSFSNFLKSFVIRNFAQKSVRYIFTLFCIKYFSWMILH